MRDYLSRQPYINLIKSIIANQSDNPSGYSFAIDGEWGSGKTWVLTELENQLTEVSENKYLIFNYNAWENDFYDEPLVAILSVMIEKLEEVCKAEEVINGINKKLVATSLKILKNLAISIANTTLQNKIGVDFKDVVEDFQKIGDENSDLKSLKKDVDSFLTLKCGIKKIRTQLSELAQGRHMIFIIDELDRCLPEYAIKVLERLHHICNEMPVIQILAINKKNLAESICKVFGKNFSEKENINAWQKLFADKYLQKFVDVIIPLPNGKLENKLDILNGLENNFTSYIRTNNSGQELINLDENYLADFISKLMSGVERRLQEKIFKQVLLCHKLTLQSGVEYKKEKMTYAILIYEIISCICRYVFQTATTCKLEILDNIYQLKFYKWTNGTKNPEKTENKLLNDNLGELLSSSVKYSDTPNQQRFAFEITDTKTYLMAFFYRQEARFYDPLQNALWDWIEEDKVFLKKYDEIMDMLLTK
ncbi:KAP family P-loop NTPase fold protein [Treponema saccharophilum]|uniref:KAP P-loop domain protein n=1 Tax=Treponema saccharophilum DSM 2985 TaxID=907348 RepID=H7EJK4_9SPIR|nr:P-loop NTPase fold protein [Treponema saccharophilum]EIC02242.1 KAP P-loop domain protein [Treponema saccharophilum DSM 2985]BDC97290.1 hypothetical protein TRSA_23890 [Treponema saccharophilum]